MKRIIVIIVLAAVLLFSLSNCGNTAPAVSETEEDAVSTTAPDVDETVTENVESVDETVDDGGSEGSDDSTEADEGESSEPEETGIVIQAAVLLRG